MRRQDPPQQSTGGLRSLWEAWIYERVDLWEARVGRQMESGKGPVFVPKATGLPIIVLKRD